MKTLIEHGRIVNEGRTFAGSVVIEDDRIANIILEQNEQPRGTFDQVVDATGAFVIPGVIDTHVHFREPGLTEKADIESESRAAAFGGVTSYCEMPNTVPQTTTLEALDEKFLLASQKSHVNYSFFFGATNDNYTLFADLDRHRIPGIKIFMGSSTGNMLVDRYGALLKIFETAARLDLPLMAHCEDTEIINRNMEQMKKAYGDDPDVMLHPLIRSEEACYESSALAAQLARTYGTHLHIAHVSTARELELGGGNITLEAVLAHLLFTSADYSRKRALIKCNPAVKRADDRDALRLALADGRIYTIATDHAPHLLSQKQGGCAKAASGMPMVQFSLPAMLGLVDEGVVSFERVVDLMCHQPAQLFSIRERGFLRPSYKADIAIVRPVEPYGVTPALIQSKCGWSPLDGDLLHWRVTHTICNGRIILNNGQFDATSQGEELRFR
ncbi:MAG: dihydroorotase [Prevotella sp.]|nr:dihydroorotase [Prevotella sp.]